MKNIKNYILLSIFLSFILYPPKVRNIFCTSFGKLADEVGHIANYRMANYRMANYRMANYRIANYRMANYRMNNKK